MPRYLLYCGLTQCAPRTLRDGVVLSFEILRTGRYPDSRHHASYSGVEVAVVLALGWGLAKMFTRSLDVCHLPDCRRSYMLE